MSIEISKGHKVTIDYIGQLENGMVFTNSKEDGTIQFEVGKYETIKGLNQAVIGMKAGEEKEVQLDPTNAFGEYNQDLLISVPLKDLPENAVVGMQLRGDDGSGFEQVWTIKEIQENEQCAILDGNHLLAGQNLLFKIKISNVDH
jgi:peptidylprolyl isomerase